MPSLRQQLRSKRRSLSQSEQISASAALTQRLVTDLSIITAKKVALYLPDDGEIDPTPFMFWCHSVGKQVYLPLLSEDLLHNSSSLLFQEYIPGITKLQKNKFGMPEPRFDFHQCIRASLLNLVLLPLVGFDRNRNRVGRGKGYYDKTFSAAINSFHRPKLVGLAHSIQETSVQPKPWDVQLDAIFTEREKVSGE